MTGTGSVRPRASAHTTVPNTIDPRWIARLVLHTGNVGDLTASAFASETTIIAVEMTTIVRALRPTRSCRSRIASAVSAGTELTTLMDPARLTMVAAPLGSPGKNRASGTG